MSSQDDETVGMSVDPPTEGSAASGSGLRFEKIYKSNVDAEKTVEKTMSQENLVKAEVPPVDVQFKDSPKVEEDDEMQMESGDPPVIVSETEAVETRDSHAVGSSKPKRQRRPTMLVDYEKVFEELMPRKSKIRARLIIKNTVGKRSSRKIKITERKHRAARQPRPAGVKKRRKRRTHFTHKKQHRTRAPMTIPSSSTLPSDFVGSRSRSGSESTRSLRSSTGSNSS